MAFNTQINLQSNSRVMNFPRIPSLQEMRQSVEESSFDPQKYLKSVRFHMFSMKQAEEILQKAEVVSQDLAKLIKQKLQKRHPLWDQAIKIRRSLDAFIQWNEKYNDKQIFDEESARKQRTFVGVKLHSEMIQAKDFDKFLKKHDYMSRLDVFNHLVRVNKIYEYIFEQETHPQKKSWPITPPKQQTIQKPHNAEQTSKSNKQTSSKSSFWSLFFSFFGDKVEKHSYQDQEITPLHDLSRFNDQKAKEK